MNNKKDKPFPTDRGFIVYSVDDATYEVVWFDEDDNNLYVGVYHFLPDDWTHWAELPQLNKE